MSTPLSRFLTVLLVAILAVATFDAAAARTRKPAKKEAPSIVRDLDGTPIIMRGYRAPRARSNSAAGTMPDESRSDRAERPRTVRRGSSSFTDIPPVNPSPNSPNSPPAAALTRPAPAPYRPPPITTYGDRVTNCIHSFPLNAGIGNNPTNQQSYVRQCAN
jgi:hypothetical protein